MTATQSQVGRELPRYRSHKDVWALKIKAIRQASAQESTPSGEPARLIIIPEESGYAPFGVTHEYMHKHDPKVGGYWVVYKDDYQSWSPAEAFEEGYTKV